MTAILLLLGLAFYLDLILCFCCFDQMGSIFQGDAVFPDVIMTVLVEPLVLNYHSVIDLTYWLSHLLDAKEESV